MRLEKKMEFLPHSNPVALVISQSFCRQKKKKIARGGPLQHHSGPSALFLRDSQQLEREERKDGWADGANNGQMGRCWRWLIWPMICSMRRPLEAGA